jgi:hypothetical protein
MFGKDQRDLAVTLTRMADLAREKSNFNQTEAKEKMREWLQTDRRFDSFDPTALIERVHLCRYNGAVLDLDDPQLRGGEPRPGDRRW